MTPWDWLASVVLFLQLPIPLYWFVLHPPVDFWRRHEKASYVTGVLASWPPVTAGLVWYKTFLFRHDWPPVPSLILGLALILFEGWLFVRVRRDLGTARLVGKTELSGKGELASHGIYAHLRHPRYVGSLLAIVGACLIAGTLWMWVVAAVWTALTMIAILLEERELRLRFGKSYREYCRRVPRFLPMGDFQGHC